MPTVLMMNWTKSVSVIDHIPPSMEYVTTTAPPIRIEGTLPRSNKTPKIVPYAMVEVTASISVYAHMTIPEIRLAPGP